MTEPAELIRNIVQACSGCKHGRAKMECKRNLSQCPSRKVRGWRKELDRLTTGKVLVVDSIEQRKEVINMKGQRGFTLIELLVVIAILGIIAAVVALNIGNFFGRGAVQSANVEAKQVETAVIAYVADTDSTCFDAVIGPEQNYPVNATASEGVHQYLGGPGNLQAVYTITNCVVTAAVPIEGSRWGDIHFCDGMWQLEECS